MSLERLAKLARFARFGFTEIGTEKDADRWSAEVRVPALLEKRGTAFVIVEALLVREGMSSTEGRRLPAYAGSLECG